STIHRNELDACSPYLQLGAAIDRNIGFEAEDVVDAEAFAEEWLVENARRAGAASELFGVVVPRIKLQARVQAAKIPVAANVIRVGVRDEDGCQFWQVGSMRPQGLVDGPGRVRARASIDADQLLPIVRHHEIVFRKFETGQRVYTAGYDLADPPRD